MTSSFSTFDGSKMEQWEQSAKDVWQELVQYDLSRDTEGVSKCLIRLCFLLASREKQDERFRNAKKMSMLGGTIAVPSPSSGSTSDGRVTLKTIETLLRQQQGIRTRLVASKRREKHSDELVFLYPGRSTPTKYYLSVCIEGQQSVKVHCTLNGWSASENFEALADTGFLVREPKRAVVNQTAVDMLQSLPDIVQLAHESPLLPSNIPRQWWPAHCETCRRLASLPTTLYKLPCCENQYCCSADCWRQHANELHSVKLSKNDENIDTAGTFKIGHGRNNDNNNNGEEEAEEEEEENDTVSEDDQRHDDNSDENDDYDDDLDE